MAGCDAAVGEVVNAGSAFEVSIGDTARLIAEVMGADIAIISDAQRLRPEKSEVERLFAANAKLRRLTGWQPRHDDLEFIIRTAWSWERKLK